ncbi:squalene/phytoene synthase family protein [Pseudohalocynthiibacter sp. F2068]|jgi:15-cis-phytoene synthase|uniref:phytoene/squalene synthase family protein n=1 Tax=Pseudohalocynthiibacter sp. F2068 TaxID=2926418 RepID=UPI001FF67638|nr:squalene/phytoene synthase family protein [Pseudohalocynthiibacter sp. F2068]MCK0100974.1 squalene/phytoene synthase family protein [Pseudohalocynthiibacter sp. F2068]
MSLQACAEQVRRGDPDRFLSAMTAPPDARAKLFPLYAFNLEVARAPWVTEEPMIAEMRLQFWRDAVEEIGDSKPPRAHEVVAPLAAVVREAGLPVEVFDALITARRWDIYRDPFKDQADFDSYIDKTAGGLMWLSALSLGAEPSQERAIRDYAYAAGVANWLRAVPELDARGRIPLLDGRASGVAELAKTALKRLKYARPDVGKNCSAALRAGWQTRSILMQAMSEPERVGEGTLGTSEFRRKGSLLWKSAINSW